MIQRAKSFSAKAGKESLIRLSEYFEQVKDKIANEEGYDEDRFCASQKSIRLSISEKLNSVLISHFEPPLRIVEHVQANINAGKCPILYPALRMGYSPPDLLMSVPTSA